MPKKEAPFLIPIMPKVLPQRDHFGCAQSHLKILLFLEARKGVVFRHMTNQQSFYVSGKLPTAF
ncbi:MAG TPA: hypothetical protein VIP29_03140 [Nitrososphaeraceae archaeon]